MLRPMRSCLQARITACLVALCVAELPAVNAVAQNTPTAGAPTPALAHAVVRELLPSVFFDIAVLDVQLWQWIGLLALLLLAWILSWALVTIMLRAARALVAHSRTTADDRFLEAAAAPARLIAAAMIFTGGTHLLRLAAPVQAFVNQIGRVIIILALAWFVTRVIDVVAALVTERLAARGQASAITLMPLGRRAMKAAVVALAGLATLQNLGFNVTAILAGLGVGGLAVALAAQKTVENLFGGLTLIADQPVRVGDFCRFGDRVGTVEDIGLRSTRIRTLDRTVVSIPNGEFAALALENFTSRDRIWFHATLGLRYETSADQLRHVLIGLKQLLASHPKVHPDPARVRFVQFGASSFDVELFAYVRTADINEFLAVQEDLLLRIMDVVAASGTGFAFPSQTLYLARDHGLDPRRREAAEHQVERWRQQKALGLPQLPSEQLARLADTLDYPPRGSAIA
ncbi:MAG: mechanosensitive ion channel family protein [Candidatus Binatia bacterium]